MGVERREIRERRVEQGFDVSVKIICLLVRVQRGAALELPRHETATKRETRMNMIG